MEVLKTRIKVNKNIYRMGFEARPLLIILAALLVICTVLVGVLGYIGAVLSGLLIYGFMKLSSFLKSEIERGNLKPIDNYFSNMNKPESLLNDEITVLLKEREWKN